MRRSRSWEGGTRMGKARPTVKIGAVWPKTVDYRLAMARNGIEQARLLRVVVRFVGYSAVVLTLLFAGVATFVLGSRCGWW